MFVQTLISVSPNGNSVEENSTHAFAERCSRLQTVTASVFSPFPLKDSIKRTHFCTYEYRQARKYKEWENKIVGKLCMIKGNKVLLGFKVKEFTSTEITKEDLRSSL